MITVKEAGELQQRLEALASELARVQQDCSRQLEQQIHLLVARHVTTLTTLRKEVETTMASSLTPERLMASLTDRIETLLQDRLTVSLAQMRRTDRPKVSPETRPIRLLAPHTVSHRTLRPERETTGAGSNLARIYALLNEDRSRKPTEIQRLTGIPKATMYRLVERYHREHPLIEAEARHETETGRKEAVGNETETAS